MATVRLRGHRRKVEIATGPQAAPAWLENLAEMYLEEGRVQRVEPVPWYVRWWRRVMRFFATVWACVGGRPARE